MKRPLYYLLRAIACTSMVSATIPMAAIAEAIQPQATAEQQAQADATSSNTGKAEDGANTNATADTVEDSAATSTGTSAANTESADATTAATDTPAPSLRAQTNGTPEAISVAAETGYAHSATASQNGVTLTLGWNDVVAGEPTTFHLSATGGSSTYKFRMDAPFYMNPGEGYFGEMVADTSRGQWMTWTSSKTGCEYEFTMTASGRYYYRFYLQDAQSSVWSLRVAAEIEVSNDAHPSVYQIITNAVAQCRQETDGSEYDMALWLHDWTLDQLEYDHSLNWCSAESGLTRHQGTCESYQRIYSKLLDAAGIANGRITGNGHTWNAVKIDGKWCQMDLTWDDTNDNWYGDLDQRHLYFGLADELMAIAHSDHTANYQKGDYAYRSNDLSNNYFARNGKADEWAEKYADRIQQHLDAREESFSIDADNQSFPPSISGIQNGIVAYAMNQREWNANDVKVELIATSCVITQTNNKWLARYDFTAKHNVPVPFPELAGASWTLLSADDPSRAVDCWSASVEPGARDGVVQERRAEPGAQVPRPRGRLGLHRLRALRPRADRGLRGGRLAREAAGVKRGGRAEVGGRRPRRGLRPEARGNGASTPPSRAARRATGPASCSPTGRRPPRSSWRPRPPSPSSPARPGPCCPNLNLPRLR